VTDMTPDELEAELAATRRIIGRVAVLLRQGRVGLALDELPVTEHERLAEIVLGDELPPRRREEPAL